jgi:hypothetical protein
MLKSMLRGWIWLIILGIACGVQAAQDAPAANPHYLIQADTVYDKKTDLTWQRCSVGQRWTEGTGCVGVIKTFTFEDAQRQGNEMWRVPTKNELGTLIDQKRKTQGQPPTIDVDAFPGMDLKKLVYWTSTTDKADGVSLAWDVNFLVGDSKYYDFRSFTNAVRLVHSGQNK